jgi:hypothetical protein
MYVMGMYSARNAGKGSAKSHTFFPVSKPRTHITYMNHVLSMSNKNIGFAENLTANKLASKLRLSCIKI